MGEQTSMHLRKPTQQRYGEQDFSSQPSSVDLKEKTCGSIVCTISIIPSKTPD
jgi:hypothetical protein